MRTLPPGLQAHLDGAATTLCRCWRVARADGVALGFTDHDQDVAFDGQVYAAASGFTASEIETSLGLDVDNLEIEGALSSAAITEDDISAGLYDGAGYDIWLVNWRNVDERLLLGRGALGEMRRGAVGFTVELRGLAHELNQAVGRVYQRQCDVDLGSSRCGVDLSDAAIGASTSVASADDARGFLTDGLNAYASGWFSGGRLEWTSGANVGRAAEIKRHSKGAQGAEIELWRPMAHEIAPGDAFDITAGCDKQFETCREKFANGPNFRGFPHMPGADWVFSYPNRGDANDGGRRR